VLGAKDTVLVEFGAPWCAPCKRLEPILLQLAAGWAGRVRLFRVDVDQAANLTLQYQVMTVPTLILFKNGQAVERMSGLQPREKIVDKMEPHL